MGWRSGICDCYQDCGICALSYFCPCIQFGLNAKKLKKGGCCTCFCWGFWWWWLYVLACIGGPILAGCCLRTDIRKKFGIGGNKCADCCCHVWCSCCAIAQEARELTNLKHHHNSTEMPNV
eukprot:TRINITY_DN1362_c0_g3_i1.p1 TRINITY_DN1362_c0_g3~~TRINITY_DN1362_c0_g3_i1.p1  ORF type:complete len:121 (-),score=7.70 TRINITY_DN1362_c0_g3_i1:60-422(-)